MNGPASRSKNDMLVPIGILGAVAAATALNLENDVYFQVGLLVTIGLASKNAILIVEFARELEAQGNANRGANATTCAG